MINEGIKNGKYTETEDSTLQDLKSFQNFLTLNFADVADHLKNSDLAENEIPISYDVTSLFTEVPQS